MFKLNYSYLSLILLFIYMSIYLFILLGFSGRWYKATKEPLPAHVQQREATLKKGPMPPVHMVQYGRNLKRILSTVMTLGPRDRAGDTICLSHPLPALTFTQNMKITLLKMST